MGEWGGARLDLERFWDQTPRTFAAIIRGARRHDIALAWYTATFTRAKELKDLPEYLRETSMDASRGGLALLGALQAMQRRGVPMQIEKLN